MTSTHLAPLLSAALLGGDWTWEGLLARATTLLGFRPAGLTGLVAATLRTFRDPPRHELRVLTTFLLRQRAFWRRLDRADAVLRVTTLVPALVAMAPASFERAAWHLPVLDTERDLADLLALTPSEVDWFGARLDAKPWHGDAVHYRP